MSRPHELTPEIAQECIAALELGATYRTCAELVGKHTDTLNNWRKRGRQDHEDGDDTPFARFFVGCTRARARGKLRHLKGIALAAQGAVIEEVTETKTRRDGTQVTTTRVRRAPPDTRASLQMLRAQEREYSPVTRMEVSGPEGAGVPVHVVHALADLTPEQLDRVEGNLRTAIDQPQDGQVLLPHPVPADGGSSDDDDDDPSEGDA